MAGRLWARGQLIVMPDDFLNAHREDIVALRESSLQAQRRPALHTDAASRDRLSEALLPSASGPTILTCARHANDRIGS